MPNVTETNRDPNASFKALEASDSLTVGGTTTTDLDALGGKVKYAQTTAPTSPASGETWYDTDSGIFRVYADLGGGLAWHPIPPVQVLEEASTFAESDVTVTNTDTEVVSGSIELGQSSTNFSVGTTASRPLDNSSFSASNPSGLVVNPNINLVGVRGTISSNSANYSTAYLKKQSDGTILDSTDISTLVSGDQFDLTATLTSGTEYRVVIDNDGASYTIGNYDSAAYPYTSGDIDIISGMNNGSLQSGFAYSIVDITSLESVAATSGNALVEWDSAVPTGIKSYDLATFQRTLDGETVTIDVETEKLQTIDDFEDGNITVEATNWKDWFGDTGSLSAQQGTVISGSYSGELNAASGVKVINVERSEGNNVTSNAGIKVNIDSDSGNTGDESSFKFWTEGQTATIGVLRFVDGGAVNWDNGTTNQVLADWSINTTYDIEFQWDFASDQVDIIINGTNEGTFALQNSVSGWGYLRVQNITNTSGITRNIYFDDLKGGNVAVTEFSDIGRNFDISTVDTSKEVKLRANLSRTNTANNPTVDYLARRFSR